MLSLRAGYNYFNYKNHSNEIFYLLELNMKIFKRNIKI